MKTKLNEYETFTDALRKVLQVSHEEMKKKLEKEKKVKSAKTRPSSHRASSDRD